MPNKDIIRLLLALRICDLDHIYDSVAASDDGSPIEDPATFHARGDSPVRPYSLIGDTYAASGISEGRSGALCDEATANCDLCLPIG